MVKIKARFIKEIYYNSDNDYHVQKVMMYSCNEKLEILEKNYILKFTYPDPDMKDNYNAIDYVVDCVYRYCSFSGGTYRPRTYQQFLKDDMGKKK